LDLSQAYASRSPPPRVNGSSPSEYLSEGLAVIDGSIALVEVDGPEQHVRQAISEAT